MRDLGDLRSRGSFDVWWEALAAGAVYPGHGGQKVKHPAVALPPTLGQEPTCPSGVLLLTGSQADYVLITPAEERERESGRGAAGWLPRPAGSPGPNTALMRAGGADGHTRGARDYCPGPRGAREKRPEERRRGDTSRDSCSRPVLLQSLCKHVSNLTSLFCLDDGLAWIGISVKSCL